MRPREIVLFERIMFGTLLLGVIKSYLSWDQLVALAPAAVVIGGQTLIIALMAGLTLLVSRRRSNIAKWVLVALFVLGLPAVAKLASDGLLMGSTVLTILQIIGQVVAYGLLFTTASRGWLNKQPVTT